MSAPDFYFAVNATARHIHDHYGKEVLHVCPAIKHLRDSGREIVPYFCEHCDHTCGGMAERAGFTFIRSGGMGSCRQIFYHTPPPAEAG